MTVIFTICSNNYLAQAKTLMDSVKKYNPGYKRVIGLVDRHSERIDYSAFEGIDIIPVEDLALDRWNEMLNEYDLIELNTSVKPSYFRFIREKYSSAEKVFYFDPDTRLFAGLDKLFSLLEKKIILLTPHILSPIPLDGLLPQEQTFLGHGIYNLGFIGINIRNKESARFLKWWEERCINSCFRKVAEGLFVDQLWINHAHLLFKGIHVLREHAYNMAPWNLHERSVERKTEQGYELNDGSMLTFYHFSSYDYRHPEQVYRPFYNRFSFESRPDLLELYTKYHQELLVNNVEAFSSIPCYFYPLVKDAGKQVPGSVLRRNAGYYIKLFIPPVFIHLYRGLKNRKRSA